MWIFDKKFVAKRRSERGDIPTNHEYLTCVNNRAFVVDVTLRRGVANEEELRGEFPLMPRVGAWREVN